MNSLTQTGSGASGPSSSTGAGPGGSAAVGKSRRKSFGEAFERTILLIHRWIGVFACLLFVMWFVTGIVLIYVRFPSQNRELTTELQYVQPIDWSAGTMVGPQRAMKALGLEAFPKNLRLEMSGDTPVYRVLQWDKNERVVSALTGKELPPITGAEALQIAQTQMNLPQATLAKEGFERDVWMVSQKWNPLRPFHLIAANDAAGTQYTVVAKTGEVLVKTTANVRFWNWVGAVPHWLYFPFVRSDVDQWVWVVDILASFGVFVVLSGIWIGIKRLRISRRNRYANGRRVPFSGAKRWHHVLGLVGGLFLTSWMVSGLWTMYPGGTLEGRYLRKPDMVNFAGTTLASFPALDMQTLGAMAAGVKRISFRYVAGEPVLVTEDGNTPARVFDANTLKPVPETTEFYRPAVVPLGRGAKLQSLEWIEHGDEYWHTGFYAKKLPVLRARFSNGEWFHIDPESAQVLDVLDKEGRVGRWTVVALHDMDWYWLLKKRPLWDMVILFTLIPGLALSITALIIGFRRLRRKFERGLALTPVAAFEGGPMPGSLGGGLTGSGGARGSPAPVIPTPMSATRALVVHSSQTGTAKELAGQLQSALVESGMEVQTESLVDTTPETLAAEKLVLFVISTTGEGEPPDHATGYVRRHLRHPAQLEGMSYAVIALGDTEYPMFCQFGRQVDAWAAQSGATRLFPVALVDNEEDASIDAWVRHLEGSLGRQIHLDRTQTFAKWMLMEREVINPGSVGGPIHRVKLQPVEPGATWEPGDIARIVAGVDWDAHQAGENGVGRDYSIASLPDEGHVKIFVRLVQKDDGTLGAGSGWLATAPIGTSMAVRLRSNPGFHPLGAEHPAIFIGNGTGFAGLRSHLMWRVDHGQSRSWLVFGERHRANDFICRDEIEQLTRKGMLERHDLVFSRDQDARRYVQDLIREHADEVRRWVDEGACIFVCGSQEGMAPGVHAALEEVLGQDALTDLAESGCYRRDVY